MRYSLFDFTKEVLNNSDKPLTYQEIWDKGVELGLEKKLNITGKTPWQSLGARLFVDVRDNEKSEFVKLGKSPARFFLKNKIDSLPQDIIEKIEITESKQIKEIGHFSERELHPLLSYFVYAHPSFNRGRSVLTKTIYHEKSKKNGYNEWLHPDIVGFYIPLEEWNTNLIEFNRLSENNAIKLYSFEIKKTINKGNYRQSFFQAVSNSSWANEGYLVAADIKKDDDLLSELERLSTSFGIGIIQLDLHDIDSSIVRFPAIQKEKLDWDTMNKLVEQNRDFAKFIQDIKIDFESKRIHKAEYDKIIDDPEKYIKRIFK